MNANTTPAEFPTFFQWMTTNRPEGAIVVESITPLEDWGYSARGYVDAMHQATRPRPRPPSTATSSSPFPRPPAG